MSNTVKKGDKVKVHYTGRLENGEVFDTSKEGEPLEFIAGSEEIIPGVSNAVIGMKIGDKATVTVTPEEAYGERMEELVQEVPKNLLPKDVEEGDILSGEMAGQQVYFTVLNVGEETAILDANHPLAGHTLTFELELVDFTAA